MSEYAVMPMTDYEGICNAVRAKTGGTAKLKSSEVKQEIEGIQTGSDPVVQPLTVTENGTYSAPSGVDGYNPVTVNVAASGGDNEWEEQWKRAIEGDSTKLATALPEGLTKIAEYAFYNNKGVAFTSLPAGVTSMGRSAFYQCNKMPLTALPSGLTNIPKEAFYNCAKMALTSLPAGVTSIGEQAFYNCGLLSIKRLPSGITNIDRNAFLWCAGLTEITFDGKPISVASNAFNNCSNLLIINVPWAEGEVSNAPWGATNATINYNYTGG